MERDELMHLCALARLNLQAGEVEAFERKFNSMLDFVNSVLKYQPQTNAEPLTLIERLDLRRDLAVDYEWPEGTRHDYRVPQIINFGTEGEG